MTTAAYYDHLRRLARDGTTADSKTARDELLAAGKTWHKDVKVRNARTNAAAALRGDLPSAFLPTKTIVNKKPTPNGARALAAAAKRSPLARRAQAAAKNANR